MIARILINWVDALVLIGLGTIFSLKLIFLKTIDSSYSGHAINRFMAVIFIAWLVSVFVRIYTSGLKVFRDDGKGLEREGSEKWIKMTMATVSIPTVATCFYPVINDYLSVAAKVPYRLEMVAQRVSCGSVPKTFKQWLIDDGALEGIYPELSGKICMKVVNTNHDLISVGSHFKISEKRVEIALKEGEQAKVFYMLWIPVLPASDPLVEAYIKKDWQDNTLPL